MKCNFGREMVGEKKLGKDDLIFLVSYVNLHLLRKVHSVIIFLLIIQFFREMLANWCIN